jgi:hypothetical protein
MFRAGEDFVERFPEAERAIADSNFRSALQSAPLHLDEELPPALRALPHAHLKTNQLRQTRAAKR